MFKPNSPVQLRNTAARAAWFAARRGRFHLARRLLRFAQRDGKIPQHRPTVYQHEAVRQVARSYVGNLSGFLFKRVAKLISWLWLGA